MVEKRYIPKLHRYPDYEIGRKCAYYRGVVQDYEHRADVLSQKMRELENHTAQQELLDSMASLMVDYQMIMADARDLMLLFSGEEVLRRNGYTCQRPDRPGEGTADEMEVS